MKTRILLFALAAVVVLVIDAFAQETPPSQSAAVRSEPRTFSSFDVARPGDERMAKGAIQFENADVATVLKLYQEFSGRSVIRSLSVPQVTLSFVNEAPLTRVEVLQALDNVLAANGITMVYLGTRYVKAVPSKEAPAEAAPIIELPAAQLPESNSYLTYFVQLKNRAAEEVIGALQPFARMPNSIVAIKGSDVLVLRDYSVNVRRMLLVLEKIEQSPRVVPPARERPRTNPE